MILVLFSCTAGGNSSGDAAATSASFVTPDTASPDSTEDDSAEDDSGAPVDSGRTPIDSGDKECFLFLNPPELFLSTAKGAAVGTTVYPECATPVSVACPAPFEAGPAAETPFALIVAVSDASTDAAGTCTVSSPVGSADLAVTFNVGEN